MSRTVHVTHGDSALTRSFAIAPENIVSLPDSLDFGPLGPVNQPESWHVIRRVFWTSVEWKSNSRQRRSRKQAEDRSLKTLDRLVEATDVVLWIGTGLADQLMLAWMPQWLRAIGNRTDRLWIVPFEKTLAGAEVPTVGRLPPDELQNHPPHRWIDPRALAYLDEVWNAVTAPDPALLVRFLNHRVAPLPLLHTALRKILWRYPDVRSGVNRYEAQLLASTQDQGPLAAFIVGETMKNFDQFDESPGDRWLFWRLHRLADPALPHPALELTGEQTALGNTKARLTTVGEQVLRSEVNFVEMNGIDDWVGGVHLDSKAGDVWFHRDGTLVRG